MGHRAKRKIYHLKFADPDMHDLAVAAHGATTGQVLQIAQFNTDKDIDPAETFGWFIAALISWNLEDEDGQPMPHTVDALLALDPEYTRAIIGGWVDAVTGVSAPLGAPSNDGGLSVEASIPMDTASPSRAS